MLKIGVFGAGHLGKIHIQQWKEVEGVELVGFYDPNDDQAASAITKFQVPRFTDEQQLIDAVDAVDIVSPTVSHHAIAKSCLLSAKHLFIEKPLAHTLEQGRELVTM